MDKHLQSHSPAQLSTDKYPSYSLFGNFISSAPPVVPYLVDAPMPGCVSCNWSLGGAFTFYTSALRTATQVQTWRHPGSHLPSLISPKYTRWNRRPSADFLVTVVITHLYFINQVWKGALGGLRKKQATSKWLVQIILLINKRNRKKKPDATLHQNRNACT